jgi:hypothetical protein
VTGALAAAGCDEQARELATRTRHILEQRSKQLAAKIAAEKAAYNASAAQAAEDHRVLVASSLQNERNERSDALAADYADGRKPTSQWRRDIADYARVDYDANRELLAGAIDASSKYMQEFADLTVEQDKVDALSKLIAALEKKPSLKDDADALGTFAADTKANFEKLVCADLKTKINNTNAAGKAATKAYAAQKCDNVLKAK